MSKELRDFARSTVLALGAIVGAVCLVWTIGLGAVGLRPLVFVSGSMAPAIEVGAVGFARSVPATEISAGDIVSVTSSTGVRLTHRVDAVALSGDSATLTLKGDANNTVDAERYTVTEVDKVVAAAPGFGFILQAVASPWGLAAGMLLLFACLMFAFRREPEAVPDFTAPETVPAPRRALRLAGLALVPAVAVGATIAPVTSTLAYFTDTPTASTPVDGVDMAPWFTCAQAWSNLSYGSDPWSHLHLDETTTTPQPSSSSPYFANTADTQWNGVYFVGGSSANVLPSTGHPRVCRRDTSSKSVQFLGGTTIDEAQYIRLKTNNQDANGPAGARWNTFSVNIWFKTDISGTDDKAGVLAAYSTSGGSGESATDRILYIDKDGLLRFQVFPGTFRFVSGAVDVADNTWHMATVTLGAGGQCLYLDGTEVVCNGAVTSAFQSTLPSWWRTGYATLSNGHLGIDNGNIAQRIFDGYIDDFSIWTRQLNATEIRDLYRAALPHL